MRHATGGIPKSPRRREMYDVANVSAGALVALATAHDERHPPENIIDG